LFKTKNIQYSAIQLCFDDMLWDSPSANFLSSVYMSFQKIRFWQMFHRFLVLKSLRE